MKHVVAFVGGLLLVFGLALAQPPTAASAQGPSGDGKYVPYVLGDGEFTLAYPEAWTIDDTEAEENLFQFSTSPSLLNGNAPLGSGDVVVSLKLLPFIEAPTKTIRLDKTLTGFVDTLRQNAMQPDKTSLFMPTTVVNVTKAIDGLPALAQMKFTSKGYGEGGAYFWQISKDVFGSVIAMTASGDYSKIEDDVLTVIRSVHFNTTVKALVDGSLVKKGSNP